MANRGPEWVPAPVHGAGAVVLLVLDGLGWLQLQDHVADLPHLAHMEGGPITSVAPTTTATALTSLATASVPARHGLVGYRLALPDKTVMNTLRWQEGDGEKADLRQRVPPSQFQQQAPFPGAREAGVPEGAVPVVSRQALAGTGFSDAHLRGSRFCGWRVTSSLVVEVARLVEEGEPFVYAYYDGIDNVAHQWGLSRHYGAELAAVDRLVTDVLAAVPAGTVVVITSDHGQVEVGPNEVAIPASVMEQVDFLSGESRFRWLHALAGQVDDLRDRAEAEVGHLAWVYTKAELVEHGLLGGSLTPDIASRLGDVALLAHAPVGFADPRDGGDTPLISRHGSLTEEEVWVPLLAERA